MICPSICVSYLVELHIAIIIELTVKSSNYGVQLQLKDSLKFIIYNICVIDLKKNQGGKLFCPILKKQNFFFKLNYFFKINFIWGLHKWQENQEMHVHIGDKKKLENSLDHFTHEPRAVTMKL